MKKGRRKKVRYIQSMPEIAQFSPRGKPGRPDEAELKIDEYEAIKLADYQGCDQSEGAKHMGISRASFGRILRNARKVLATALVEGRTIRIRIADVQVGVRNQPISTSKQHTDKQPDVQSLEETIRQKILNHDNIDSNKDAAQDNDTRIDPTLIDHPEEPNHIDKHPAH